MKLFITAIFFVALGIPPGLFAQGGDSPPVLSPFSRLEAEIGRAAKIAEGTVGVCAVHLESGQRVSLNEKERFPMASTYKLPVAVQIFSLADRGELSLERMIAVRKSDLRPGSGVLAPIVSEPGLVLSVRSLLEFMLLVSDNTAADLLLRLAGGPRAVTERMRTLGLEDMSVDRPTVQLLADAAGYALPPETEWTPAIFKKLYEGTAGESRKAAVHRFLEDRRDTSTPENMAALIGKIHDGSVLSPESRAELFGMLERCQTGRNRIRGFLLPDTVVAHKTGTIAGTASDAGRVTLPDGAGHVALALFIKGSEKEGAEKERAIARISRAIYDYFLFRRQ